MSGSAIISPCGLYRYTLHRQIPSALRWVKPCLFGLLNPSKADATVDDNTLRRGLSFARSWGCTSLTFINLFAFRATDPRELMAAWQRGSDVIGPDNDRYILEQLDAHCRIGIIVAAWGTHPLTKRRRYIQKLFAEAGAQCLGTTKAGDPRHPLYLSSDVQLTPWALPGGV